GRERVDVVGLGRYPNYYPYQLWGGMQQRVAIARASGAAEDPVDGRAVQRARRDDAGRTAGPAAEALDRSRADDFVCHPRSRRGALRRPASNPAERVAGDDRAECRGATALPAAADRNPQRARVPQTARASLPQHGRASDGRPGGRAVKAWTAFRDSRAPGVILLALLLLIWQLSATYWFTSPTWPTVTRIFEAWFENIADGTIPGHLIATLWRQMLGYGLAVVIGITLGLAMGYWRQRAQHVRRHLPYGCVR